MASSCTLWTVGADSVQSQYWSVMTPDLSLPLDPLTGPVFDTLPSPCRSSAWRCARWGLPGRRTWVSYLEDNVTFSLPVIGRFFCSPLVALYLYVPMFCIPPIVYHATSRVRWYWQRMTYNLKKIKYISNLFTLFKHPYFLVCHARNLACERKQWMTIYLYQFTPAEWAGHLFFKPSCYACAVVMMSTA